MKRVLSLIMAAVMVLSLVPTSFAEETNYIAAPYEAVADNNVAAYYAPVFYENGEGEPVIGVTFTGVIVEDGKHFKDSDNDKELDAYEDWRLPVADRVADLVPKMTQKQRIGLLTNQLMASPGAGTGAEAYDESGSVIFGKLMADPTADNNIYNEDGSMNVAKLMSLGVQGSVLTVDKTRSGVIRKDTDTEVGALFNNTLNLVAENDAVVSGEVMIPYMLISNPMLAGYPATQGFAAAAMGDGSYDVIKRFAEMDAEIWDAKGIHQMYGPQIDLISDPRWSRNSTTYTEVPEVMAGIADALVQGYQHGADGAQKGDVALIMKHFPGDGSAENGLESHYAQGQYRLYPTEGSLEKYQLVGFQAAIDAGLAGIMPCYSRDTADGRSVTQTYRGVEIPASEIGSAYSTTILQLLLKDTMGFKGFINSDSNIISTQNWGAQEMTPAERYAMCYNAGCDVVGDGMMGIDHASVTEAVTTGLVTEEAFYRATSNRMTGWMEMGMFDNPYRSAEESKAVGEKLAADLDALKLEINRKSVVLMKNHEGALPLKEAGKKVFVASLTNNGEDEAKLTAWTEAFTAAGYTVVEDEEEAEIAFLDLVPGGYAQSSPYINVLDLVDGEEVEELNANAANTKTGEFVDVTTLESVKDIAKIAKKVHENGGKVIASIDITNSWILTNVEPHVDALIGSFSTSVAARMDVLTGAYNPTGKLPVTLASCREVVALSDQEIDGVVYQICASPNDVPGYDKDQYIDPAILEKVPGGSYAYCDADGNYYRAWHGLSY